MLDMITEYDILRVWKVLLSIFMTNLASHDLKMEIMQNLFIYNL
jgi:hypothetical protein